MTGTLVLSFDVELGWGTAGRLTRKASERVRRGRALLPELLEVVQSSGLVATWAVTMALGHEGPEALRQFLAQHNASSLWPRLCREHPDLEGHAEAYFSPEFLKSVLGQPTQELACHGYSHTVWDGRPGASEHFDQELRLSQALAQTCGAGLQTLVFPKNRYSEVSLEVARARGFAGFRGDEFVSGLRELTLPELLRGRARRFLGAFGKGASTAFGTVRMEGCLFRVPGGRFLRLEDPGWLRPVHLAHVRAELRALARPGEILHIWCHPENLTSNPRVALDELRSLLALGVELREAGRIENRTMAELCSQRAR